MHLLLKAYTLSECMETMAEYVSAYEKMGGKNIVFCEDRLTLLAEKQIAKTLGGTFQTSVFTFSRFLESPDRVLSKQGSVMAVGEVMTRLQREEKLQCFTTLSGVGNHARCIYETLAQFSASEITPEVLQENLTLLTDPLLKKKVSDLALIFEGYNDFLKKNGYLDESAYLSLLPNAIRNSAAVKGANVFFLCFSSFTAQAVKAIRASLETADNVVGIFCAGEEEFYTNSAWKTFARACAEYGKPQIKDLGVPIGGEAEILRKGLFDPERKTERFSTQNVRIFEAEDKSAEAEYVALKIKRELMENPDLRYRDIAVLTPGVGGYTSALKKSFAEYGIAYSLDEKKSLKNHPLRQFLLDCFALVKDGYSPVVTQSFAQNVFFGESDEYRNYLLKFANYRGGAKREIKRGEKVETLFDIAKLEDGRMRILKATSGLKARSTGRAYCLKLEEILKDFAIEEKLNELSEKMEDRAQKNYLAQIFPCLKKVLAEISALTGDKEMTIGEFSAILQDGLDATEISLIPPKADAVFVGDITDSRIEKVAVLFVMGMTDEVPRQGADTAIVSDKEIEALAEVKTLLEPTIAEVNLRARESVCLNLCTFTKKLYLSYPLSADASEPSVSEVFRYVDRLFCDGKSSIARRKKLDEEDFQYCCSAPTPAIRQLLIEKDEYELLREDRRKQYASLYAALDKLSVQEKDDFLRESEGHVRVECGEDLFFKKGKISPTALENYFSCPFKHFVERGLRLKEREETAVLASDTGNFIHDLLEKTMRKTEEWKNEDEVRMFAESMGRELLENSSYFLQQDTASGAFSAEKLVKEGADVAVAAYRQIKNSSFRVEETEKPIQTELFNGKVDRVDGTDRYVRIVDYKTGSIDDSVESYYTGRKIQMQLYMSDLKGKRIPAGVYYFPASVKYRDEEEGRFRMQGFMNGDQDALLCGDHDLTEGKKSEYFPASLKKNPLNQHVMDEEVFRDFLDYSVYVARGACQELKEGYIAPTPYAKSCDYCKYGGMCGFHKESGAIREEKGIRSDTVAQIARKYREGEEK